MITEWEWVDEEESKEKAALGYLELYFVANDEQAPNRSIKPYHYAVLGPWVPLHRPGARDSMAVGWMVARFKCDGTSDKEDFETARNLCELKFPRAEGFCENLKEHHE